jgi:hypothetical protein
MWRKSRQVEHEADAVVHELATRLDRSFITPLDREDIYKLAQELDNVVDLIDGTARRAAMFDIREPRPAALRMADILHEAVNELEESVRQVKERSSVAQHTRAIKKHEEAGDCGVRGGGRRALPGHSRSHRRDQVEGNVRHAGGSAGSLPDGFDRRGEHLHQAFLIRGELHRRDRRGRVSVRLHQRIPRLGEFHRHRGRDPGPQSHWSPSPGRQQFNFLAAFTVGTAVAKTVGKGMIDVNIVTPNVILGGLLGAIIWNVITWWYGLPSSSSHALVGGYAGAAVAKAGWAAIIPPDGPRR